MASSSSGHADDVPVRSTNWVALKAAGAVFLVLLLIAGGVLYWVYESFGGYRYQPTDRTVRAARITADSTARKDVETIATQLSPIVGEPEMRAVVDYCWDTGQAWHLSDNSIACRRPYYLYYPLGSAPAPSALGTMSWPSSSGSHVAVKRRDTLCDADLGLSTACFRASTVDLELMVVPASAKGSIYGPKVVSDYVESDLWKLKVGNSSIVVIVSSTYYVG